MKICIWPRLRTDWMIAEILCKGIVLALHWKSSKKKFIIIWSKLRNRLRSINSLRIGIVIIHGLEDFSIRIWKRIFSLHIIFLLLQLVALLAFRVLPVFEAIWLGASKFGDELCISTSFVESKSKNTFSCSGYHKIQRIASFKTRSVDFKNLWIFEIGSKWHFGGRNAKRQCIGSATISKRKKWSIKTAEDLCQGTLWNLDF